LGDKFEKNEMGGACSAYGGEERLIAYRVLIGKPEFRSRFGDPDEDGRIILRWIFRQYDVVVWTGSS
jgi:hypothetical protein